MLTNPRHFEREAIRRACRFLSFLVISRHFERETLRRACQLRISTTRLSTEGHFAARQPRGTSTRLSTTGRFDALVDRGTLRRACRACQPQLS